VLALHEDQLRRIWGGSAGGLSVREPGGRFVEVPLVEGTASPPQVRTFAESRDGTLWIGTLSGLYRVVAGRRPELVRPSLAIMALLIDRTDRLWIGHSTGVVRLGEEREVLSDCDARALEETSIGDPNKGSWTIACSRSTKTTTATCGSAAKPRGR
jgi:ligand-binding sensor domain-containing protein